jgi:hypothetical protein
MKSIYYLVLLYISLFFISTTLAQIADITRLPVQNPGQSIKESAPIWISESEILIFYVSPDLDTIYSIKSNDRGINWEEPKVQQLVELITSQEQLHLTAIKSTTGRIFVAWSVRSESMKLIFSDDEGESWSDPTNILGGGNFPVLQKSSSYLNLTQLDSDILILSFSPFSLSVPYYRTSSDDGLSWSFEPQLFPVQTGNSIRHLSIVSTAAGSIIGVFQFKMSEDYGIYSKVSSDGGNTWSDTIKIVNGTLKETHPRILKDDSGALWLLYLVENESGYGGYLQNDIYILKSTDSGITWIENQRLTKYIGDDNYLNISSYNNITFLSFASERFTNEYQIAYGIPGETVEVSTPPKIIESSSGTLPTENPLILRATVIDDEEVNSVKVFVDGSPGAKELFDDGNHNDLDSGDAIYGNEFPPPPAPGYFSTYFMDVNKIEMPMNNRGTFADVRVLVNRELLFEATDINNFQSIKLDEINYYYGTLGNYDEIGFLFAGGFGLSGYNFDELWGNAQMSSSLIENYLPGKVGADPEDPHNVIYVVNSSDPPFGDSWQRWKDAVLLGADFYDGDNDGIYNPVDKNWNGIWDPTEDMPDLLGDETTWCIFNDGQPAELRTRFGGIPPQGIEIQQTIFASSLPELEDVIFLRYKITNKGTVAEVLDSVIFGFMADPDIGVDHQDDLVGCDTILSSGFCYNYGEDQLYGINPPAFYTTLLQGPIVESQNPSDIAYERKGVLLGVNKFFGHKNQDIISSVNFVGSDPTIGDPNDEFEMKHFMKGLNRIGNKLDPCNHAWSEVHGGVDCSKVNPLFWYSGDSVEDIGWIMTVPTDIREMLSVGEFTLEKDKPVTIIGAYVLGRGTDALNSITVARENVRKVILEYESNFASLAYNPGEPVYPIDNYALYQNYPNPFNPTTTIRYELLQDGIITIKLYDILGQEVATILNEFKKADRYELKFDAGGLASGVYIYRMKVNDFITSKKMILLR